MISLPDGTYVKYYNTSSGFMPPVVYGVVHNLTKECQIPHQYDANTAVACKFRNAGWLAIPANKLIVITQDEYDLAVALEVIQG